MTSTHPIRKAVIAAAGFGTRFLPQTKAMPKEMLPLIDKPIIQYVVEELVSVGVEDIVIVTGANKRNIEDHFDRPSQDLLANLKNGGADKQHLIDDIEAIADMANFIYVRQKGPYGNGTPLVNVEHLIGNEPFIYTFSDDFIVAKPTRFQQIVEAFKEFNCPILSAIRTTSDDDYSRYGYAGGKEMRPGILDVQSIIEKPGKEKAPSNFATVSGGLLTPEVYSYIHKAMNMLQPGAEFYYNDALKLMISDHKQIIACQIQNGRYYDSGNKLEYLKTVVDFALARDDIKQDFLSFLRGRIS